MSLYVLDTDHLTLYHYGHERVGERVDAVPPERLAVTVVSAEEMLTGWYTQVRRARSEQKLAQAYEGLFAIVELLKQVSVLPFTLQAIRRH